MLICCDNKLHWTIDVICHAKKLHSIIDVFYLGNKLHYSIDRLYNIDLHCQQITLHGVEYIMLIYIEIKLHNTINISHIADLLIDKLHYTMNK